MIKIVLIITDLGTGGAETMLLKLVQHMDRVRFDPYVISLGGGGEIGGRIQALGIPVNTLGMRPGIPNPLVLLKLVRMLRRIKPHLVHTWMYHADLLGGVSARLAGYRCVIWGIRQSNLSRTVNKRSTLWVVKACALLSRYVPRRILSCSMKARETHIHVGYETGKIRVIPNGFDLDRFRPDLAARSCVRAELGLSLDTPLVGLVARYDPQKNHIGFVRAAAMVRAALPSVHFILVGSGNDEHNVVLLESIAAHDELRSCMHLLGKRDDVPRLMAALDVLASSSHGEAFPNVLGEAMACGVPCVVTEAGDSAEIVGPTGRTVPVGDMAGLAAQLLEVLHLSQRDRLALGESARARVAAEYDIAHVTGLYQMFYERMLTESKR